MNCLFAGRNLLHRLTAEKYFVPGNGTARPIEIQVFTAHRHFEHFPGFHNRRDKSVHPVDLGPNDLQGWPGGSEKVLLALEVDVQRKHELVGRAFLDPEARRASGGVAIDNPDGFAWLQIRAFELKRGGGRIETISVHPAQRARDLLESNAGIGALDRNVPGSRWVLVLKRLRTERKLFADHKGAARLHRHRSHRVGLLHRAPASRNQGFDAGQLQCS